MKPGLRILAHTTFTRKLADAILEAVEKGMSLSSAAQANRVGKSTVAAWKHEFPTFTAEVAQARARCVLNCLTTIHAAAAAGDWRAHAWILSRVFHEEFGERSKVELQLKRGLDRGIDMALDAIKAADLGPEVYAKILEAIEKIPGHREDGGDPEEGEDGTPSPSFQ